MGIRGPNCATDEVVAQDIELACDLNTRSDVLASLRTTSLRSNFLCSNRSRRSAHHELFLAESGPGAI